MKQLAVTPKIGFDMIGVGVTKGYELIKEGELETFKIGRSTRITTASIESFVARRIAAQNNAEGLWEAE